MNMTEYKLACLSEEAGEVTQAIGKALRFGLNHVWPDGGTTNVRALECEIAQLVAVAEMLGLNIRQEDKDVKKAKVMKYAEISVKLGTLE